MIAGAHGMGGGGDAMAHGLVAAHALRPVRPPAPPEAPRHGRKESVASDCADPAPALATPVSPAPTLRRPVSPELAAARP